MPFKKDRNSRDDRPKRTSRGGDAKFSKDDKFGKREDRPRLKSTGDGDRKFKPADNREHRSSFDRPERSFDRSDRPFDKSERNVDKPRKSFDKFGRNSDNSKRSFDRSERSLDKPRRPFDKFDKSFDKPKRSFDKPERRFEPSDKPYGKRREFDKQGERGGDWQKRKSTSRHKPAVNIAEDDGLIRLNRYISNAGICSRRKADELITAGVITVNGEVITELGTKVDPAKDEIRYNNERLRREKMVYVLLNKPKDYITTTDDPQERRTVMQLVSKATNERIYPIGRLDRNTTGLLLLTNDGNLAEKLSHPRNNVSKIYNVELDKNLTQGDFNKLQFGVQLEDGFVKPDDISYVTGGSKREIGIQIHSGKNRIVRRMFEHLGYEVVKLDRVVYANLTKKDLPRGRWRYLEERELIQLKHFIKPK